MDGDQVLNVSVREDHIEREGPIIAQLNVTDEDLEPCNIVTYTIEDGNNDGNFRIGSQSGSLELNRNLTYESHPDKYTLTIRATNTECGDRRYSDEATVYVFVMDINEEHPTFEQHMYTFTFDEGQQPSDFVQLRCSDSDSPGAQILYEASFSQNENPFTINHWTGYVSATESLDYEQQMSYNLTFTCYNIHDRITRDMAVVSINVNPVNEYLPTVSVSPSILTGFNYVFPIGILLASARNNSHAPIKITVTDPDSGIDHGKIRFILAQGNEYSRYFHVDVDYGDLTLIRPFDFDVCGSDGVFTFTVCLVACDAIQNSSRYGMYETATITIFISPTPDVCNLTFLETNYSVTVSEAANPETELLQVHCVVPGGGPLQQHTIKVLPPNSNFSQTLRIDHDRVILQQNLDYEVVQNFTTHLNCSDSSGQESIASLFVQVLPENDNLPYFEKSFYIFNVNFDEIRMFPLIIGYVTAMDDDKGIGGNLTFALNFREEYYNGSLTEYVILNQTAGHITVALVMINYPREEESTACYDISVYDGRYSAQSRVIVSGLGTISITSNESHGLCGTVSLVFIILAAVVILFLLLLLIFCYAARKNLKYRQGDPLVK